MEVAEGKKAARVRAFWCADRYHRSSPFQGEVPVIR
jgi:hypothetical protein